MIVDCYTHTWDLPEQLGKAPAPARWVDGAWRVHPAAPPAPPITAGVQRHFAACEPADVTFVLGFRSRALGAEIPNQTIADYVAAHPDKLIGFAGIDPSHPRSAIEELHQARDKWGLRGVAVAPAAQDFHPSHSQSMQVYAEAGRLNMPVIFHPGIRLVPATRTTFARPALLDELARELPNLKIVIAHLGFPWVAETIDLLARHENVFAETSLVHQYPWQGYQALVSAFECGVMSKILFGSGFPFAVAAEAIEALYSVNHVCHGTGLPTIPREALRSVVERDALTALGLA